MSKIELVENLLPPPSMHWEELEVKHQREDVRERITTELM